MVQIVTYIKKNPNSTKRVIGLSNEQLNRLIDNAKKSEKKRKEEIAKTEIRLIKSGGGRKSILNREEQIILTLFYLHNHPTFEILGIHFNVCESTAK